MTRHQQARLEARLADPNQPPQLLDLPPNHPARLKGDLRTVAAAIAHVDRMFEAVRYAEGWWLFLKDDQNTPTLVAPHYYLFRRVLGMEQLQEILNDLEAELDDDDDMEEVEEEEFPLFVWGLSFGPIHPQNSN